jgi:hypothetical protein
LGGIKPNGSKNLLRSPTNVCPREENLRFNLKKNTYLGTENFNFAIVYWYE